MPIVRCPTCNRALKLPEAVDIVTAKCPMCQTAFDAAAQVEPPRRPPPSAGGPPVVFQEDTGSVDEPSPFGFEREADPIDRDDRKALANASAWLKAAGLVGLGHSLVCWCGSFAHLGGSESVVVGFCIGYVLQLVVCLLVYNGANALVSRRSLGTARLSALMSFLAVVLEAMFAIPLLVAALEAMARPPPGWGQARGEETAMLLVMLGLRLLLVVLFLTGGIKTVLALQRPDVRRAFPR